MAIFGLIVETHHGFGYFELAHAAVAHHRVCRRHCGADRSIRILTYWNLSAVRTTWDTLAGDREFVRGIDKVLSDLKDAETGQRGYLFTGDERYLEPYTRSHAGILASIERLRSLAGDSGSRQGHLNAVAEASAAKLAELERAIALRRQDGLEAAIAVRQDRPRQGSHGSRPSASSRRCGPKRTRPGLP